MTLVVFKPIFWYVYYIFNESRTYTNNITRIISHHSKNARFSSDVRVYNLDFYCNQLILHQK